MRAPLPGGPRPSPITPPLATSALLERLENVVGIGLEYLSLNRETDTLSGGESQRVRMVKHLGSSLVDVLYIFDEPSVGLHPRDVHRLNELLGQLRDKGNTVIVVEHDPAGTNGGNVVCESCNGSGVVYTDLAYLAEFKSPSKRARAAVSRTEVLAYKYDGKSISDVLELTAAQALEFFSRKEIVRKLEAMRDVGPGYVTLRATKLSLKGRRWNW